MPQVTLRLDKSAYTWGLAVPAFTLSLDVTVTAQFALALVHPAVIMIVVLSEEAEELWLVH